MEYTLSDKKKMNRAMRISFCVGIFMLVMKTYAYFITDSSAILSDAAESIVHVFAVGFAVYSMWLSLKPADRDHAYGHDRIAFFSAGFEGALILIAAIFIVYQAIFKLIHGIELKHIDLGMLFVVVATTLNGFLGIYLVLRGKKYCSLVLEADGKHILTDCFTSLGVIIALVLTRLTGWLILDPLIAIAIGLNILWTGTKLIRNAVSGLMDRIDPILVKKLERLLTSLSVEFRIEFHRLRYRNGGNRLLIETHLLFPKTLSISEAHEVATKIEKRLEEAIEDPLEFITHLEPIEGHDEIHTKLLGRAG
ncbi:MAG: cation transporter [Chlamydiia bacterium]|nr:cation transporter [Chlamydiia bacterium]